MKGFKKRFIPRSKKIHYTQPIVSPELSADYREPTIFHSLGGDDVNEFIDVDIVHLSEVARITGINYSWSPLDFTILLCKELNINPGDYLILVPSDFGGRTTWVRPPPSRKLADFIPQPKNVVDHSLLMHSRKRIQLKLMAKKSAQNFLKPWLTTTASVNENKPAYKTGRELLNELGTRIVVHLPEQRKTVVRSQLNHPVFEAVAYVCMERNLTPNRFFLQNPANGVPVDPLATFNDQNVSELQLRACDPSESNLNCLLNLTQDVEPYASSSVFVRIPPQPDITGRTKTLNTTKRRAQSTMDMPVYVPACDLRKRDSYILPSSASTLNRAPPIVSSTDYENTVPRRSQQVCALPSTCYAPGTYRRKKCPAPPPPPVCADEAATQSNTRGYAGLTGVATTDSSIGISPPVDKCNSTSDLSKLSSPNQLNVSTQEPTERQPVKQHSTRLDTGENVSMPEANAASPIPPQDSTDVSTTTELSIFISGAQQSQPIPDPKPQSSDQHLEVQHLTDTQQPITDPNPQSLNQDLEMQHLPDTLQPIPDPKPQSSDQHLEVQHLTNTQQPITDPNPQSLNQDLEMQHLPDTQQTVLPCS